MKRLISLLTAFVLTFSLVVSASAIESQNAVLTLAEADVLDTTIRELLGQRARLQLRMFYDSKESISSQRSLSTSAELNSVNQKLTALGVKHVDITELSELMPESADIMFTSEIEKPVDGDCTWSMWTTTVSYTNGYQYNVTTLCAEANSEDSPLYNCASKTIHAAPGLQAGNCDFLITTAVGATGIIGTVATTFYSAFRAVYSALSTSTVINNIRAVYIWQTHNTVYYRYVKPVNADTEYELVYMDNVLDTVVHCTVPTVTFGNNVNMSFDDVEISKEYAPSGSHVQNAVNCYVSQGQRHNFVESLLLEGIDGEYITRLYPCSPLDPEDLM